MRNDILKSGEFRVSLGSLGSRKFLEKLNFTLERIQQLILIKMYNLGLYRLRLHSQKGHRLNICSVTKYKDIWFHRLPKGNREKNNLISFYSKLKLNNTNTQLITHGSTLLHAKIFTSSCQSKKKGAIQSIFHKVKSNFHMTVLCSEICSCLFFDYKDYPFLILIAFLFWNNFRFTEKFQRWHRKFLHIYHSISPIVITLHHLRTFVKN